MNRRAAAVVSSVLPSWLPANRYARMASLSSMKRFRNLFLRLKAGGGRGGDFSVFLFFLLWQSCLFFFFLPFLSFLSLPSPPHGLHCAVRYRTLHIVHTCYDWLIDWLLIGKPLEKEGRKEGKEKKKKRKNKKDKSRNKQKGLRFYHSFVVPRSTLV